MLDTPRLVNSLWRAMANVQDPEFQVSIVDMGLVVGIDDRDGRVTVTLTFTAMGCPATDMIIEDVRTAGMSVPGVTSVEIEVVWNPIWTSARLTPTGRLAFQEMGIAV